MTDDRTTQAHAVWESPHAEALDALQRTLKQSTEALRRAQEERERAVRVADVLLEQTEQIERAVKMLVMSDRDDMPMMAEPEYAQVRNVMNYR